MSRPEPKANDWHLSAHAIERFIERFAPLTSTYWARKHLREALSSATRLRENTRAGDQRWLLGSLGIVAIVKQEPLGRTVVTVEPDMDGEHPLSRPDQDELERELREEQRLLAEERARREALTPKGPKPEVIQANPGMLPWSEWQREQYKKAQSAAMAWALQIAVSALASHGDTNALRKIGRIMPWTRDKRFLDPEMPFELDKLDGGSNDVSDE